MSSRPPEHGGRFVFGFPEFLRRGMAFSAARQEAAAGRIPRTAEYSGDTQQNLPRCPEPRRF